MSRLPQKPGTPRVPIIQIPGKFYSEVAKIRPQKGGNVMHNNLKHNSVHDSRDEGMDHVEWYLSFRTSREKDYIISWLTACDKMKSRSLML